MRSHNSPCNKERGVTMIEVLVTIVIVTIGLLGLAGLQARIQAAELESYQRVQALILMQDMVDRLKGNRDEAVNYVAASVGGAGGAIDDCTAYANGYKKDLCEWNNTLLGASETTGGTALGAMIGARGCISNPVAVMPYEFVVAVAWQGMTPTAVPTASACGAGQYGANDALRRVVTTRVVFSCLRNSGATTCDSPTP